MQIELSRNPLTIPTRIFLQDPRKLLDLKRRPLWRRNRIRQCIGYRFIPLSKARKSQFKKYIRIVFRSGAENCNFICPNCDPTYTSGQFVLYSQWNATNGYIDRSRITENPLIEWERGRSIWNGNARPKRHASRTYEHFGCQRISDKTGSK